MAATQEQAQKHSWSCTRRTRERVTETQWLIRAGFPGVEGGPSTVAHSGQQTAAGVGGRTTWAPRAEMSGVWEG